MKKTIALLFIATMFAFVVLDTIAQKGKSVEENNSNVKEVQYNLPPQSR